MTNRSVKLSHVITWQKDLHDPIVLRKMGGLARGFVCVSFDLQHLAGITQNWAQTKTPGLKTETRK